MKSVLISTVMAVLSGLLLMASGTCAMAAGPGYFPTSIGSTWSYNTQALTLSGTQTVMMPGTETVEVLADGRFKSYLNLEIGSSGYAFLAVAYAAATNNATILLLDTELAENLTMNRGVAVILKGGYNADFNTRSGLPTKLKGKFTILSGRLTVDRVTVK